MKKLLYFSSKCTHSNDILHLIRSNNLQNNFRLIDIAKEQVPEYIKSVPSLIIPKGNGEADLLVGSNLFKWVNDTFINQQGHQQQQGRQQQQGHQQQQGQQQPNYIQEQDGKKEINHEELNKHVASKLAKNEKKDISDYEPGTMNGFSDNFSFLSDNGPIDHNFSFLGGGDNSVPGNKQLPFEDRESSSDVNNQEKKNEMDKAYAQMMSNRTNDSSIPAPISRQ
jgi:hypothetical protein